MTVRASTPKPDAAGGRSPSQSINPKRAVLALRLLILAALVLLGILGGQPDLSFWFLVTLYLTANLVYAFEAVEHFLVERLAGWIFLFDVGLVSLLFLVSRVSDEEVWIPYFLTILVAALAANMRVAFVASIVSAAVHGLILLGEDDSSRLWSSRFALHTPSYFGTALFVGALAESARRERQRRANVVETLAVTQRLASLVDLERLSELARDPRALARAILDLSQELFADDTGSLMLTDERSQELRVAVTRGMAPIEAVPDPQGIAAHVFSTRRPTLLIGPPGKDPRFLHVEPRLGIRSSISVPVVHKDVAYGVLNFNRTNPLLPNFTPIDMERALSFAGLVGVALANLDRHRRLATDNELAVAQLSDLRASREEAIRTERIATLDEVLASVARNLNDPLTSITLSAEMARDRIPHGSELHLAISAILQDAERCRRMVAELEGIHRQAKPSRVPVDLVELVEYVLYEHEPSLRRAGVVLVTSHAPGMPLVSIDRQMIVRVFTHLVDNAIRAMEQRTDAIRRLSVTTRLAGSDVEVEIRDSGAGLRIEHVSQLFQPFFTTRSSTGATGLGLATAERMVRANGGKIRAISEGGEGVAFQVSFPALAEREPRTAQQRIERMQTHKIQRALLLEADGSVARAITTCLGDGFLVKAIARPELLMSELHESLATGAGIYGVIILDLTLPEAGHLLLERIISETPEYARRLIITASSACERPLSLAIDSSGAPFLSKPFKSDDLRAAVASLSGR